MSLETTNTLLIIDMKVAIIGCGNIGSKRAIAISKNKGTLIKYIVGKKKRKVVKDYLAQKISKKLKVNYTTDRTSVIGSDVESVILSTQPDLFLKVGKEILRSKKHLLVEKPLGLNSREAEELIKVARKNHVYLKTGFNLRFDDGIILAKKLITKKNIGKIFFIKIEYVNGAAKTNKNGVGSLSDIGSHSLNLFEYFVSKKLKILNSSWQQNEYFKDDNGFVTIKSGNILGFIHHSFVRWENKFFLEISGEKGSITVDSLPKWGKQTVTYSKRVYPSGKPKQKKWFFSKDNSWLNEGIFFKNQIKKKNFKDIQEGLITMKNIDLIKKMKN